MCHWDGLCITHASVCIIQPESNIQQYATLIREVQRRDYSSHTTANSGVRGVAAAGF